jgi:tetratricopeptide (TPR) repeat protein
VTLARRAGPVLLPFLLLVVFLGTLRRAESGAATSHDTRDSRDVQQLTDLGERYEAEGRGDLAEAAYRRALTIDARDGDVHVRLGELLLKRGNRAGALAEAEEALRWHPGGARARDLAARAMPPASAVNDQ